MFTGLFCIVYNLFEAQAHVMANSSHDASELPLNKENPTGTLAIATWAETRTGLLEIYHSWLYAMSYIGL